MEDITPKHRPRQLSPRFPYALDSDERVISAREAKRHTMYKCLDCGKPVFARGRTHTVVHFAHVGAIGSCAGEGIGHCATICAILKGIESAHANGTEYVVESICRSCGVTNRLNLAGAGYQVLQERMIRGIRPDLLITDPGGNPLIAMEVIWTHGLSREKIQLYAENNLPVIAVIPKWEHIAELLFGISSEDVQVFHLGCPSPNHPPPLGPVLCDRCQGPLKSIKLAVWRGYCCHECRKPMSVLEAYEFSEGQWRRIEKPTRAFWHPAAKVGVRMDERFSPVEKERYLMHLCPHCDGRQYNYYVYNHSQSKWTPDPTQPIRTGYFRWCPTCNNWNLQTINRTSLER